MSKKTKDSHSPSHIYVFVNLRPSKTGEAIEYYVVPSAVVAAKTKNDSEWYSIALQDVLSYKDRWDLFLPEQGHAKSPTKLKQ